MRYSISVLIRPAQDAEAGDLSNERWYQGEADVPPGMVPSLTFPNEGEITLYPMNAADAGHYDGTAPEPDGVKAQETQAIAQALAGDDAPAAAHSTGELAAAEELTTTPNPTDTPGEYTDGTPPGSPAVPEAVAPKSAKKGK